MSESPQKLRRRWLRFSLRFMLLLVAVIAIPLAWKVNRVRNQRAIIAEVRQLGGGTTYDFEYKYNVGLSTNPNPPGPVWLREILGVDYFADVIAVHVSGPQVTDEKLRHFATLPHLQGINVMSDTITDSGVAALAGLQELTGIAIGSKQLTGASVDYLQGLSKLYWFECSGKQVDDSWVPHIVKLKTVQCIQLDDTRVTDDGIAELVRMPLLHGIYFCDMPITDFTLDQLHEATKLTRLGLHQTNATPQGIKRFQSALPGCTVRNF